MRKNILFGKKGVELSANFLVMLILGIVGFVFALMFIPKLFQASNDVNQQLDSQSKDILMNQAMEGRVAIYPETFETKTGSGRVIGLGIFNVGETQKFAIGVKFVSGPPSVTVNVKDWAMVDNPDIDNWYPYKPVSSVEVKKNDRVIESIFLKAPKGVKSGKYTFAILVKKDKAGDGWTNTDESYAGSKLVTITVV